MIPPSDHHRWVARVTPNDASQKDQIYLVVGDSDDTNIAQQLILLFARLVAHQYLTPDATMERFLRCAAQLDQEVLLAFHLWSVALMETFEDVFVTAKEKVLDVLGE